jgi:hypothetical protein
MTEEEVELMKRFEITVAQKSVYTYKCHNYESLDDAVNYARFENGRRQTSDEREG